MLELAKRVQDDIYTRDELLDRCCLETVKEKDIIQVAAIMHTCFKIPTTLESLKYLIDYQINLDLSVKCYDPETQKIYGILLFGANSIDEKIPFITHSNAVMCKALSGIKQLQGCAFILDERLRGTGIDKKMICYNKTNLSDDYDVVWCGVNKELKTHNYWKRLGFNEFHSDPYVNFYLRLL